MPRSVIAKPRKGLWQSVFPIRDGFPRKKAALMAAFLLGMTGWNAFCNSSFYIPNSLFPFSMARAATSSPLMPQLSPIFSATKRRLRESLRFPRIGTGLR